MIKKIIEQRPFFLVSKDITKIVGVEASVMLAYLLEELYDPRYDTIKQDGKDWFYLLSGEIEEDTTLSYRIQKTCIEKLKKSGFIDIKFMGMPRRLYFHINGTQYI